MLAAWRNRIRDLGLLLLTTLGVSAFTGVTHAQTATIEVIAPSGTNGVIIPATQYDLRINYAFAGGDVESPRLVVALPRGVILAGLGGYSDFQGNCTSDYLPEDYYAKNLEWVCTFTANSLTVDPGAGRSGQIPLRVRFMPYFFQDQQQVPLSATLSGSNFATVTHSAPATVATTRGLSEQPSQGQPLGFARADATSPVGPFTLHARSPDNAGSFYVHPGAEMRETFPAGSKYLGHRQSAAEWTTTTPVWGDASSLVHSTVQRFGFGWVGSIFANFGSWGSIRDGAPQVNTLVWNACDSVPAASTWSSVLWGSTAADGSGFGPFLAASFPGTFNAVAGGSWTPASCTTPLASDVSQVNATFGNWFFMRMTVVPPAATVPLYDFFANIALPAEMEYRYPVLEIGYARPGASDPVLYRCHAPAQVGVTLNKAEFDVLLAAGACAIWDPADGTIYGDSEITHLAGVAPVVYSAEPWGPTVWGAYSLRVDARRNTCGTSSASITPSGYVALRRTEGGALNESQSARQITLSNLAYLNLVTFFRNPIGASISSISPGARAVYQVSVLTNLGINPWGTVKLPPGFRLLSHRWAGEKAMCMSPNYQMVERAMPDGSTELDIDLGPEGSHWTKTSFCASSPCQPSGDGGLELELLAEPTYPFLDGQTASFVTSWNTENNREVTAKSFTGTLTLDVPAGMQLRMDPICSELPGAGNRQPGVIVQMSNTGGSSLTNMVAVIPVPSQVDGSGTEVDVAYAAHIAPSNVTVECSSDGGAGWSSSCDATTTHLRFVAASVQAHQTLELQVYFDVPIDAPVGAAVFVTGGLDANELLPVAADTVAPAKVELCPGSVEVSLWFDTDGDGARDADEPALPTWPFEVMSATQDVYAFELEPDGTRQLNLAGGAVGDPERYTYVAIHPTTPQAVWSWTRAIPSFLDVVSDGSTTLNLPATCTCDDGNTCTIDTCNYLGQCSFSAPDPLCEEPQTCDDTCAPGDVTIAYAIVYDADGVARGTIRCTHGPLGAVTCDQEEDQPGHIKVYDALWCPGVTP